MKLKFIGGLTIGLVAGAALGALAHEEMAGLPDRGAGSNEVLKEKLDSAPGLEVVISDVVIPPNAQVPRHYHPGEEFLYLLEGTATHIEEGSANRDLKPGDAMVIRMGKIHSPKAGPEGARAVVFRVHLEGEPERVELE
jgi:quercetin dioxygenase-like cupin family protein